MLVPNQSFLRITLMGIKAGSPEVIEIQEVATPIVKSGWVLINVKAFGLNRSELFTRRGDIPSLERLAVYM